MFTFILYFIYIFRLILCNKFNDNFVKEVNSLRKIHYSPKLLLDEGLSKDAEKQAKAIAKTGNIADGKPMSGQNTYLLSTNYDSGPLTALSVVSSWYNEVCNDKFDFDKPNNENARSFTQLVWKDTSKVGVGKSINKFPNDTRITAVVALFKPPGNIVLEGLSGTDKNNDFIENVRKGAFNKSYCDRFKASTKKKSKVSPVVLVRHDNKRDIPTTYESKEIRRPYRRSLYYRFPAKFFIDPETGQTKAVSAERTSNPFLKSQVNAPIPGGFERPVYTAYPYEQPSILNSAPLYNPLIPQTPSIISYAPLPANSNLIGSETPFPSDVIESESTAAFKSATPSVKTPTKKQMLGKNAQTSPTKGSIEYMTTEAMKRNFADDISLMLAKALRAHNALRDIHNAGELRLVQSLNDEAEATAKINAGLQRLRHSRDFNKSKVGENLAFNCKKNQIASIEESIKDWYKEVCSVGYDFDKEEQVKQGESDRTRHFRQVVWKDTRDMGCGRAITKEEHEGELLDCVYYCCKYLPPANIPSAKNLDNVQKGSFDQERTCNVKMHEAIDDAVKQVETSNSSAQKETSQQETSDSGAEKPSSIKLYASDPSNSTSPVEAKTPPVEAKTPPEEAKGSPDDTNTPSEGDELQQDQDERNYEEDSIKVINRFREIHGADPLLANEPLHQKAKNRAYSFVSGAVKKSHKRSETGENVQVACNPFNKVIPPEEAIVNWYQEVCSKNYQFNKEDLQNASHFTQLVWKDSKSVGIAYATKKKANGQLCTVIVAEFEPNGNVRGNLKKNVKKGKFEKPYCGSLWTIGGDALEEEGYLPEGVDEHPSENKKPKPSKNNGDKNNPGEAPNPENEKQKPSRPTKNPGEKPSKSNKKPEKGSNGNKPDESDDKPENSVNKPERGDKKPERSDKKPEGDDKKPERGNDKPEGGDNKPESGDNKPESGDKKPESGDKKPEGDDNKPDSPIDVNKPEEAKQNNTELSAVDQQALGGSIGKETEAKIDEQTDPYNEDPKENKHEQDKAPKEEAKNDDEKQDSLQNPSKENGETNETDEKLKEDKPPTEKMENDGVSLNPNEGKTPLGSVPDPTSKPKPIKNPNNNTDNKIPPSNPMNATNEPLTENKPDGIIVPERIDPEKAAKNPLDSNDPATVDTDGPKKQKGNKEPPTEKNGDQLPVNSGDENKGTEGKPPMEKNGDQLQPDNEGSSEKEEKENKDKNEDDKNKNNSTQPDIENKPEISESNKPINSTDNQLPNQTPDNGKEAKGNNKTNNGDEPENPFNINPEDETEAKNEPDNQTPSNNTDNPETNPAQGTDAPNDKNPPSNTTDQPENQPSIEAKGEPSSESTPDNGNKTAKNPDQGTEAKNGETPPPSINSTSEENNNTTPDGNNETSSPSNNDNNPETNPADGTNAPNDKNPPPPENSDENTNPLEAKNPLDANNPIEAKNNGTSPISPSEDPDSLPAQQAETDKMPIKVKEEKNKSKDYGQAAENENKKKPFNKDKNNNENNGTEDKDEKNNDKQETSKLPSDSELKESPEKDLKNHTEAGVEEGMGPQATGPTEDNEPPPKMSDNMKEAWIANNALRSIHGSQRLKPNQELNNEADEYSKVIVQQNIDAANSQSRSALANIKKKIKAASKRQSINDYGMNTFTKCFPTDEKISPDQIVLSWWASEFCDKGPSAIENKEISPGSQVVWNASTSFGMSIKNYKLPNGPKPFCTVAVALYLPKGNNRDEFDENVKQGEFEYVEMCDDVNNTMEVAKEVEASAVKQLDPDEKPLTVYEESGTDDLDQDAFRKKALEAHNNLRNIHNSPSLELDDSLSKSALNWVKHIARQGKLERSNMGNYGENLAYKCSSGEDVSYTGDEPTVEWYSEACESDKRPEYDFKRNDYVSGARHFTQLIWKSSLKFGIAYARAEKGKEVCYYAVARYSPPGNKAKEYFANVKRGNFKSDVCDQLDSIVAGNASKRGDITPSRFDKNNDNSAFKHRSIQLKGILKKKGYIQQKRRKNHGKRIA